MQCTLLEGSVQVFGDDNNQKILQMRISREG